ncbi:glucose PTS transporter transcription antiterminator GlcT [Peribacillus tepidiphilus]|uniref:glucose PTS transporter transcription antiterminator GlcT n=1 Tax=Peribacillus tepidiphilus TaxID=2652445 RepID=UPI001290E932|nr:PRD domain-containing protein [Peribacillus tepidiphilus]
MEQILVSRVLNNNVIIAQHPSYNEVVLIGKGIGFNRKKGDEISAQSFEKMFVLKNEVEQESYKKLIPQLNEEIQTVIIEAISYIQQQVKEELTEHFHVALTDHLMVAIHRQMQGMEIRNPFLVETSTLYPFEYKIAHEVLEIIGEKLGISLPKGEAGFIALHIHSGISNRELLEINKHSMLVSQLIQIIEEELEIKIDKESLDCMRLIRHLHFTIHRVLAGEYLSEPEGLSFLLKNEYPVCYNLAWKLIKIMQQSLNKPIYDAEAVYLTMHLQRIRKKYL